jgi:hypothetical protein
VQDAKHMRRNLKEETPMQTQNAPQSCVRRTVNDLVMTEMFLVQAAIESAIVLGDGFSELGRQIVQRDGTGSPYWASISGTLQRIADDAVEPYTSRFRYLRDMMNSDN